MKKTILIVLVLALLAPVAAFAATEFSLGGFINMDTIWDSTQNPRINAFVIGRNNDQLYHHGHFIESAQASRFNFTIKGPKIWGATTTGLIELDFEGSLDARVSSTQSYAPRLRHAMFRLNWPETELMFGQYWGMFAEFLPEVTSEAVYLNHGAAFQRVPQIRLTQKFLGDWTVAAAICKPYDPSTADANFEASTVNPGQIQYVPGTNTWPGQNAESPQLQGKLAYEKDLWGKAPFYGRPRGFVAQLNGAWQRTRYHNGTAAAVATGPFTFGQNAFGTASITQNGAQTLNNWVVQGTMFIPVIPTYSANLAGTASLTPVLYIGQGTNMLGMSRDEDNSWFDFRGINALGQFVYDRKLMQQWGGTIQAQYWFTNQWYLSGVFGGYRNYGIDQSQSALLAGRAGNPAGYQYASNNDQAKLWTEANVILWYRPIEALKFGLSYSYERTDYLQKLNNPQNATLNVNGGQNSAGAKDVGESHRLMFQAIMYY